MYFVAFHFVFLRLKCHTINVYVREERQIITYLYKTSIPPSMLHPSYTVWMKSSWWSSCLNKVGKHHTISCSLATCVQVCEYVQLVPDWLSPPSDHSPHLSNRHSGTETRVTLCWTKAWRSVGEVEQFLYYIHNDYICLYSVTHWTSLYLYHQNTKRTMRW